MSVLYLERPSFWTETRDGEVWFRALDTLSHADAKQLVGSPRSVWQHILSKALSRRTAMGLFGASPDPNGALLYGVGLLVETESGWALDAETVGLLSRWRQNSPDVLEDLGIFLVKNSTWIRCLLCRLLDGDWTLCDWQRVRSNRKGIKSGESLLLHKFSEPERWLEGLEHRIAGQWLVRTACDRVAVHPSVLKRNSRRDDLSLTPLSAPLHLFESIGWLSPMGELHLPAEIRSGLAVSDSPAQVLTKLTSESADFRGFVPAEPTLRELLATFGARPSDEEFSRWMDRLVESSVSTGALEILGAEPGQARHGRGLFGDPARKLVRWVVHQEFNDRFQTAWAALGNNPTPQRDSNGTLGEELT